MMLDATDPNIGMDSEKIDEIKRDQRSMLDLIHTSLLDILEYAFENGSAKNLIVLPSRFAKHYILGSPRFFQSLNSGLAQRAGANGGVLPMHITLGVKQELEVSKFFEKKITVDEVLRVYHDKQLLNIPYGVAFYMAKLHHILTFDDRFFQTMLATECGIDGQICLNLSGFENAAFTDSLLEVIDRVDEILRRL